MPRDVFPHADDKQVINLFLRGLARQTPATDFLIVSTGKLGLNDTMGNRPTIAWFDTAGALVVSIHDGIGYAYSMSVIHEMCRQLGLADVNIVRQRVAATSTGAVFAYFIDGTPVRLNDPYVLVGALGMRAWQESQK